MLQATLEKMGWTDVTGCVILMEAQLLKQQQQDYHSSLSVDEKPRQLL